MSIIEVFWCSNIERGQSVVFIDEMWHEKYWWWRCVDDNEIKVILTMMIVLIKWQWYWQVIVMMKIIEMIVNIDKQLSILLVEA